jgi:signal transduction histidine kinase
LPPQSAVYYYSVDRDGADQNFHPLDYLDRVAAVAGAPVYSWVDSAMDHGIVGGYLKNQTLQVRTIGGIALRVLRGEPADSIPISSPDLNVNEVDWRQLRRWGISESRVPAGTMIRFREPSAWDRYKIYILGVVVAILAQTALIAGLLLQHARRREAERKVLGSQAALRATYERNRALGARLLLAQETERARIARELHDDISQQMALLEMDLKLMGNAAQGEAGALAGEALDRVRGIARTVHDLSHRLHPAKLRLIGLVAALDGLQRELSHSGIAITVTHDNIPSTLPQNLTVCVFRIVQEALQNAVRYSGAHAVSVHVNGDGEQIALVVADDGRGFDVSSAWGKGLGLISMGERVEAIGGTFAIHSTPGAGTRLEVNVPLAGAHDSSPIAV